jgi:hypothetical protein
MAWRGDSIGPRLTLPRDAVRLDPKRVDGTEDDLRGRGQGAGDAADAIAAAGPDHGLTTMFWAVGVAASFMLAAAFGALWYATRADLAATRENVARLEAMVLERDRQVSAASQENAWMKDPRAAVALLKAPAAASAARGWLLFDPGTRQALLRVSGLPPLPPEKTYALWAFAGDQPVPAGTFDVTGEAPAAFPLPKRDAFGGAPARFAVSVEAKGGAAALAPAGEVVLAGETFPAAP